MSKHQYFKPTAIVIALAAVFPVATAWADEVEELTNPNVTEATLNLPIQDNVNPLYRQYQGVNQSGLNGNVDLDVVNRDENGQWFKLQAENLGLRTQEIGVSYEKQGDWSVGLEYNQIPRYAPYDVRTSVTGVGSNTITQPAVSNGGASPTADVDDPTRLSGVTLMTQRDITTLTATKYLDRELKLSFSFKNEDKTGARMFGVRGNSSGTANDKNKYGAMLFAPEPIDQNHQQIEAALDYATRQYQISAGYYGSFLNTANPALTINGKTGTLPYEQARGLTGANPVSPLALAPDNSLNQFYVNGAYNFSRDTRANLKVSYSEARQKDEFIDRGMIDYYGVWTGAGDPWTCSGTPLSCSVRYNTTGPTSVPERMSGTGSSLDALIQTTEVFGSLTSRITKDLKVLASWRYEDREDKTAVRAFEQSFSLDSTTAPTKVNAVNYYNNPESYVSNWGKLEADYKLGAGYSANLGIEYKSKQNDRWAHNEYAYGREEVREDIYRLVLSKGMSQTLNGSLLFARSNRTGSPWNVVEDHIYPTYLADRDRDRMRAMLDWAPADRLNLQLAYEAYRDDYTRSDNGLDDGKGAVHSLDATYLVTDDWQLNAWYSKQTGTANQTSFGQGCLEAACTSRAKETQKFFWDAKLKLDSDQVGLGLKGKIRKVEVGAQYLYSEDRNEQEINNLPTNLTQPLQGVLPDTKYVQSTFKLFASYPLDKATTLRADYIYDLRKMDDYTWNNWVYADGTRVFVDPKQTTQIIGVSLSHKF